VRGQQLRMVNYTLIQCTGNASHKRGLRSRKSPRISKTPKTGNAWSEHSPTWKSREWHACIKKCGGGRRGGGGQGESRTLTGHAQ
jgi:hypothetical protein